MTNAEIAAFLKEVPYFSGLDEELIESVAEHAVVKEFASGEVIIEQGTPGEGLGVLVEGEAQAFKGQRHLKDLRSGDYMGDMSLLDGAPHTATLTASTAGRWIIVSPAQFRAAVANHPEVGLAVIGVLMERLREALQWLEEADAKRASAQ